MDDADETWRDRMMLNLKDVVEVITEVLWKFDRSKNDFRKIGAERKLKLIKILFYQKNLRKLFWFLRFQENKKKSNGTLDSILSFF